MDAREIMPEDIHVPPERRSKRIALHLDPSAPPRRQDDPVPPSASPVSGVQSPIGLAHQRARRAHETEGSSNVLLSPSGSQSTRPYTTGGAKVEKEKRKRSRVTPDQLLHLERFFASDRSPTASRRREISELLGMQERQTQIWFQNRRAKAKLQDGKQNTRGSSAETPPDTPPQLSTGLEIELQNLIHEVEPVTIIPCTDLSIGTWRRIATTVGKHDLVAYVCEARRCFTWFIHSDGYGFKMEIAFDSILDTKFSNASPGNGLASLFLSRPPVFYLEHLSSPRADGSVARHWKRCADWTEGQQASKILRHDLIGSAVQLAHVLKSLRANSTGSDVRLHVPPYNRAEPFAEPPQQHSATLLHGLGLHHQGAAVSERPSSMRKRSHSGPPTLSLHNSSSFPLNALGIHDALATGPLSAASPSSSYSPTSSQDLRMQTSPHFGSAVISPFPTQQQNILMLDNYGVPRQAVPRTYAVHPSLRFEDHIPESLYTAENHFSSVPQTPLNHSPSPTLLNTPHGHGHLSTSSSPQVIDPTDAIMASLPALAYEPTDGSL